MAGDQPSDMFAMLTQGSLVRVNRSTFEVEPWLAEKWESSADGLTHTLHLRRGVTWSDGTPFTSADVLFTLQAMYDPKVQSVVASSVMPGGKPIQATAPDAATVVLTYGQASGSGISLLDMFPILPKHKLESAYKAGTFPQAWTTATAPSEIVGTGPFVLREFKPGERLVFDRNPTYWRTAATVRSCRTSIGWCCSSFPSRTRNSWRYRRARPISRKVSYAPTTTCRFAAPKKKAS